MPDNLSRGKRGFPAASGPGAALTLPPAPYSLPPAPAARSAKFPTGRTVMKLLRCRTKQGETAYGSVNADGSVSRVVGCIFGAHTVVADKLAVDKILAPVQPTNIICIGLNYRKHAEESKMPIPGSPVIFFKNNAAACNPDDIVALPHMNPDQVDYECELAIVIGRAAPT